ncbi:MULTISPECIES: hypothetical protein [Streptomyces]|nr:hypothetical protein [Streptomyces sp. NRRL_B-2557]MDX2748342.1 hypothetical protein [Streptomyces sp. NRRL_B-2557]
MVPPIAALITVSRPDGRILGILDADAEDGGDLTALFQNISQDRYRA